MYKIMEHILHVLCNPKLACLIIASNNYWDIG
jgi:hypothetical protein